jgi:hypothetical protein
MKNKLLGCLLCLGTMPLWGQLVNDGATITIMSGATLFVESHVQNNGVGTININDGGTLEVQGNFTNNASGTINGAGKLKFSGNTSSTLTMATDAVDSLIIAKSSISNSVTLQDAATTNSLVLTTGKVVLGLNNLNVQGTAPAAISGGSVNSYVEASGSGKLNKALPDGASTQVFPVGDNVNYTPITSSATGAATSAKIGVNLVNGTHPNRPTAVPNDASDYISRYWDVDITSGTVASQNLTATYVNTSEDVTGSTTLIKGASQQDGATGMTPNDWTYAGAANASNTITGTTTNINTDFTGMNFFGKANLKVFLNGAYSSGTMSTNLNNPVLANNILEQYGTSSPYSDANASVSSGFFINNPSIVDWIKVEMRDPLTPTIASSIKASGFIKNNGTVVGLDGSSYLTIKNAPLNSTLVFSHRNHVPFRTQSGIDLTLPATPIDFTIANALVFNDNTGSAPLNTISSTYLMWQGDASGTTNVVNSTDVSAVKASSATAPTGYFRTDVNLSGTVNSTDVSITKSLSASPKTADL